jgi:hypothetical protein
MKGSSTAAVKHVECICVVCVVMCSSSTSWGLFADQHDHQWVPTYAATQSATLNAQMGVVVCDVLSSCSTQWWCRTCACLMEGYCAIHISAAAPVCSVAFSLQGKSRCSSTHLHWRHAWLHAMCALYGGNTPRNGATDATYVYLPALITQAQDVTFFQGPVSLDAVREYSHRCCIGAHARTCLCGSCACGLGFVGGSNPTHVRHWCLSSVMCCGTAWVVGASTAPVAAAGRACFGSFS